MQSERLHWGWKKVGLYVFFKSQSLPLVYWLRGLIGMYICINTAIGDPLCVCVCVSGQARCEELHQIDSQKEKAASRLSQGLGGLTPPSTPKGGG